MNEVQDSENVKLCMNEACEEYQKGAGYVITYGKTEQGIQRYRCMACKKTFTETKGTVFYRLRHSEEEIRECVALVGERKSFASIHRMKGIKEETVCHWIERIDAHVKHLEGFLLLS
jgi:transposase-like protein